MRYTVTVIPRSSRVSVEEVDERTLRVKLTAPPVEGEANKQLVATLAEYFGVSKSCVSIVKGQSGRRKTVDVIEKK